MLLENLANTMLRWLRIPPGTSLRKAGEVSTSSAALEGNPYVEAILSITVDDVCVGETPLSLSYELNTPEEIRYHLDGICAELNSVVSWIAYDLLKEGAAYYKVSISDTNKLVVLPFVTENPVHLYLDKNKKLTLIETVKNEEKVVKDVILFVNYDRSSLTPVQDESVKSKFVFEVNPKPMQLANVDSTVRSLSNAEKNLDRFRAVSSRVARWANVDIGTAQGDQQKDTVDSISSAINANSLGLSNTTANDFDDNIPVLPNRKGLGRVELQSDFPNYNLKDVVDINYYLSKLCLLCRFPGTYIDFTKNLDSSAVTMVRGDIRYSKLCAACRSLIVTVLNDFMSTSEKFKSYHPVFSLTQYPTTEDDDVMDALSNYIDIASSASDYIDNSETVPGKLHRLKLLQILFDSSCKSPILQDWFNEFSEYLVTAADEDETEEGSGESPDFGDDESFGGESDLSEDFSPESESAVESEVPSGDEDIEFIEPGTI